MKKKDQRSIVFGTAMAIAPFTVALVATLCVGAARSQQAPVTRPDILSVGRLELVDSKGTVRGYLGTRTTGKSDRGTTEVALADTAGTTRIRLTVSEDGYATVTLQDPSDGKKARCVLRFDKGDAVGGRPKLEVFDSQGRLACEAAVLEVGPGAAVFHSNGKLAAFIGSSMSGKIPRAEVIDAEGTVQARIGLDKDGKPYMVRKQ